MSKEPRFIICFKECLGVDQLWPDGNGPDSPKPSDVVELIELSGCDPLQTMREWNLGESLFVYDEAGRYPPVATTEASEEQFELHSGRPKGDRIIALQEEIVRLRNALAEIATDSLSLGETAEERAHKALAARAWMI